MPIRKPLHPNRQPISDGFMSGEWITTNGFDVIFYVSDGSTIEIMEQPDGTWHAEHWIDGNAEFVAYPTRQAAMQAARDHMKANGLKSVPSPEQRAAPWFKGDDYEYTVDKRGKRQFANGLTVIDPPGVQIVQSAVTHVVPPSPAAYKPGEVITINIGGTVVEAKPNDVISVTSAVATDPNEQARMLNAMLQAYKLNELLKGK